MKNLNTIIFFTLLIVLSLTKAGKMKLSKQQINCAIIDPQCFACDVNSNCWACNSPYVTSADHKSCVLCSSFGKGCTACTSSGCTTCGSGTYANSSGQCAACTTFDPNCSGCSSSACTSCSSGWSLAGGKCVHSCSYYDKNCNKCSTSACTGCSTGYTLSGGVCQAGPVCSTFDSNCSTCTTSACTACSNNLVLYGGHCVTCTQIDSHCSACNSSGCTTCSSPYDLTIGKCVLNCSNFDPNCASCTSSGCSTCNSPYSLTNNGTCGLNCQSLGFNNCSTCSTSQCTACSAPYTLVNGSCQLVCSYFDTQCSSCSVSGCNYCYEGYTLTNGKCPACSGQCPCSQFPAWALLTATSGGYALGDYVTFNGNIWQLVAEPGTNKPGANSQYCTTTSQCNKAGYQWMYISQINIGNAYSNTKSPCNGLQVWCAVTGAYGGYKQGAYVQYGGNYYTSLSANVGAYTPSVPSCSSQTQCQNENPPQEWMRIGSC